MKKLTTEFGSPVVDDDDTMTAGPRGSALRQDVWLLEKRAHCDRGVIAERHMHAKASGAYGTFTVTRDISGYTPASAFAAVVKKAEIFARFSTGASERGAADAERDIRGFAVKFHTDEGDLDLVGNNTMMFLMRNLRRFSDLNHAVTRDPQTNLRCAHGNRDYWTLLPEALHQVTIVMSDHGIPADCRHRHDFGSQSFSFIHADNVRCRIKFHLAIQQRTSNYTDTAAEAIIGDDRESSQPDLFDAIDGEEFPRWKLCADHDRSAASGRALQPV